MKLDAREPSHPKILPAKVFDSASNQSIDHFVNGKERMEKGKNRNVYMDQRIATLREGNYTFKVLKYK
jgi:hypothetical protein